MVHGQLEYLNLSARRNKSLLIDRPGFLTWAIACLSLLLLTGCIAPFAALGSTVGASSDFIYWNSGPQKVTIIGAVDGNTVIVGSPSTGELTNYLARFTVVVSGVNNVFVIRSSV